MGELIHVEMYPQEGAPRLRRSCDYVRLVEGEGRQASPRHVSGGRMYAEPGGASLAAELARGLALMEADRLSYDRVFELMGRVSWSD
jgi:hypothetical protein